MDQSLYPGLKNAASFLEVVDGRNAPLCIMAEKDVLRQRLRHRATALLIRDSTGRALLSFREGQGWGFSSFAMVRAGQSFEECARDMLQEDWGEQGGRLLSLGLCPPCRESRQAFVALFEARLPAALAAHVSKELEIPVIGIGAGPECDGQVLVWQDMLGLCDTVAPKFVKRFGEVGEAMRAAFTAYAQEVKGGTFPAEEHCYSLEGEAELLEKLY